jgi:hypothetical protein
MGESMITLSTLSNLKFSQFPNTLFITVRQGLFMPLTMWPLIPQDLGLIIGSKNKIIRLA